VWGCSHLSGKLWCWSAAQTLFTSLYVCVCVRKTFSTVCSWIIYVLIEIFTSLHVCVCMCVCVNNTLKSLFLNRVCTDWLLYQSVCVCVRVRLIFSTVCPWIIVYCIAFCSVLHCVLYCIVYCIALCVVLHSVLYCILCCIAFHIVFHSVLNSQQYSHCL